MVAGIRGRINEQKLMEVGLTTLDKRRIRGDMIQTSRILTGIDQLDASTWFTLEPDREGRGRQRQTQQQHHQDSGGVEEI